MIARFPVFVAALLSVWIASGAANAEDTRSSHYRGPEFVRKIPGFRLLFGDYALTEEEYNARYGTRKSKKKFDEKYYEPEPAAPAKPKRTQATKSAKAPAGGSGKSAPPGKADSSAGTPAKTAAVEGMPCDKASSIVSGYGFASVTPESCKGKVYAFNATRDGKKFAVKLDAKSGELTEVKKLP